MACSNCGNNYERLVDGLCRACNLDALSPDPFALPAEPPPAVMPHACCGDAAPIACVCAYAYECRRHGHTHVGTHD